jgi:hypothetical protein
MMRLMYLLFSILLLTMVVCIGIKKELKMENSKFGEINDDIE